MEMLWRCTLDDAQLNSGLEMEIGSHWWVFGATFVHQHAKRRRGLGPPSSPNISHVEDGRRYAPSTRSALAMTLNDGPEENIMEGSNQFPLHHLELRNPPPLPPVFDAVPTSPSPIKSHNPSRTRRHCSRSVHRVITNRRQNASRFQT